tara:strand:+ start:208 stop:573 length:366 start_codon:yes stop_codon:yes gene_type:complete
MAARTIKLVQFLVFQPMEEVVVDITQIWHLLRVYIIAYVIVLDKYLYVPIEIVLYPTFNHVCVVPMVFATKTMVSYAPKQHRLVAMHQHVNIQTEPKKILEFANAVPLIVGPPLAFSVMLH